MLHKFLQMFYPDSNILMFNQAFQFYSENCCLFVSFFNLKFCYYVVRIFVDVLHNHNISVP